MELAIDRVNHRIKARSWPLGAARSRLFLVLRHLRLRSVEIDARVRSESEQTRAFEVEQQLRLHAEAEAARLAKADRAARSLQEQEFLEAVKARKEARRIKEATAYERMTDEQRMIWQMEEEIVGWVSANNRS
jgi:hypothetical protein